MKIYEYSADFDNELEITVPRESTLLKARVVYDTVIFWMKVNEKQPLNESRTFKVFATGHDIPTDLTLEYIDTCFDGSFIWHIFEVK